MKCQLEHANISVQSIENAVKFLTTAFPHFQIRGGSKPGEASRWVHVGTEDSYIAFAEKPDRTSPAGLGIQHLGFVVDDAAAVYARLKEAGYKEGYIPEPHPHRKRIYFHDADGLEWEFIEYLSDEPSKRNDYLL